MSRFTPGKMSKSSLSRRKFGSSRDRSKKNISCNAGGSMAGLQNSGGIIDETMEQLKRLEKIQFSKLNGDEIVDLIKLTSPSVIASAQDSSGQTLLHTCIEGGHLEQARILLTMMDCNVRNKNLWTPLHMACDVGNLRAVEMLLDCPGVDITKKSKKGASPLHHFVRCKPDSAAGKYFALLVLLGKEGNICSSNLNDDTPFMSAVSAGNLEVAVYMAEKNWGEYACNVNHFNKYGETALHYSARSGDIKGVEILLRLGVDASIEGKFGTAAKIAGDMGHSAVVELLEGYMKSGTSASYGIDDLPDEVRQSLRELLLEAQETHRLDISDMGLRAVPTEVFGSVPDLEILDVSGNLLSVVPEGILGLSKLRVLRLDDNKLETIPKELSDLPNLVELTVTGNRSMDAIIQMQAEAGSGELLMYLRMLAHERSFKDRGSTLYLAEPPDFAGMDDSFEIHGTAMGSIDAPLLMPDGASDYSDDDDDILILDDVDAPSPDLSGTQSPPASPSVPRLNLPSPNSSPRQPRKWVKTPRTDDASIVLVPENSSEVEVEDEGPSAASYGDVFASPEARLPHGNGDDDPSLHKVTHAPARPSGIGAPAAPLRFEVTEEPPKPSGIRGHAAPLGREVTEEPTLSRAIWGRGNAGAEAPPLASSSIITRIAEPYQEEKLEAFVTPKLITRADLKRLAEEIKEDLRREANDQWDQIARSKTKINAVISQLTTAKEGLVSREQLLKDRQLLVAQKNGPLDILEERLKVHESRVEAIRATLQERDTNLISERMLAELSSPRS